MKPVDIVQLALLITSIIATVILMWVSSRDWRENHNASAHRLAVASTALLLVEAGSLASLGAKMRWWGIEGMAEWVTTMGRTAILTLVIWLAWEKALDIRNSRVAKGLAPVDFNKWRKRRRKVRA